MIDKKAKVTDEHRKEAALLAALWEQLPHPSQAIFGEQYEIGSQSAVGQFLRGDTPLSLKAAAGFAAGLGCKIADFSPRLAKQAMTYADLAGLPSSPEDLTQLSKPEAQLVLVFRELSPGARAEVMGVASGLRNVDEPGHLAQRSTPIKPSAPLAERRATKKKTEDADH